MGNAITWTEFFGDLARETVHAESGHPQPENEDSTFEACLSEWVASGTESEARHAAARIMRACRMQCAEELNLGDGLQESLGLKTLPDCIGDLTHVRVLRVVGNRLLNLPDTIGQMTRLRALHLFGNRLSELPESICHCADLERLYLAGNRLIELPPRLGDLRKLEVLSVPGNCLTALPESIGMLARLRELYLFDNPLLALPASLEQLRALQRALMGSQALQAQFERMTKTPPPGLIN